uniref:Uncharacterized protein n=1 Tax=Arcella intermedia TaxID=1963864 RepID=A0A6B2LBB8_9EUKA
MFVDTDEWDQEDGRKISSLWSDAAIQKAWGWPSEVKTIEHLDYFVERVQVYLQPNYTPVREEILRARQRTTGFTETTYLDSDNSVWTVIDVGGQFSERSKWIHLVSRCSSFIYVVAIDEYNVKSKENKTKSRLACSLETFKEIINSEAYSQLFPVLFLNKIDKFKSKLENSDLFEEFKGEYPSYSGSQDWKEAVKVIESDFRSAMPKKNLVVHHTCVLDGENMKIVFAEVRQHILVQLLEHTLM